VGHRTAHLDPLLRREEEEEEEGHRKYLPVVAVAVALVS
jgi:hypothetical protein